MYNPNEMLQGVPGAVPVTPLESSPITPSLLPMEGGSGLGNLPPATRLEIKLARARAATEEEKRRQDVAVMPTILHDMERSEQRVKDLTAQIDAFHAKVMAPPQRSAPRLDQADMLTAGIAAALGAPVDQALGGLYQGAAQRSAIDYANQDARFQADQANQNRQVDFLQRQLLQEQQIGSGAANDYRSYIAGQEQQAFQVGQAEANRTFQSAEADKTRQFQERERAQQRFQTSDNEGEVVAAAAELERLGSPVPPAALAYARDAAKQRGRTFALQVYAKTIRPQIEDYQGVYPPGVLEQLERTQKELEQQYGIDLPPVPGGATWKRQFQERDQALKERETKRHAAEFEKRYKQLDAQFRERMAAAAASRAIAQAHVDIAARNATTAEGRLKFEQSKTERDVATERLVHEARLARQKLATDYAGNQAASRALTTDESPDGKKSKAALQIKLREQMAELASLDKLIEGYKPQQQPTVPLTEMQSSTGAKFRIGGQ